VSTIALLALLAGCTTTPQPTQQGLTVNPSGQPTDQPTALIAPTDCGARIGAANLTDEATINAVDDCRFTAGGAEAARSVLAAGGSRDQLWAAVWVYSSASSDPAPLLPLLQGADSSVRVMAAAAVARLGDRAGLTSLSDALADGGNLAGSRPPLPVAQFAVFSLSRFVDGAGAPAPATGADDETAVANAWRAWLEQNASGLSYDQSRGEWVLP
jgi:hypothetical protein